MDIVQRVALGEKEVQVSTSCLRIPYEHVGFVDFMMTRLLSHVD